VMQPRTRAAELTPQRPVAPQQWASERRPVVGAPGFEVECGLVEPNRLHYLLWHNDMVVDGGPSLGRLYRRALRESR